jgi:hypothetical protein
MKTQAILACTPVILSQEQRRRFFEQGYLKFDAYAQDAEVGKLQAAWRELMLASGTLTHSNSHYELADDHCASRPHPVVVKMVADLSADVWDYVRGLNLTNLAVDLLGPDVKFRETYINYKLAKVGRRVSWHQDFPFFPTTNRAMITVLTYIEDVTDNMGPVRVLPESHRGPLYDHYDESGWIGRLPDDVVDNLALQDSVSLAGPAGTVVVFDNFMVHGSEANLSDRSRPVMVTGYAAADAFAYTATPPSMRSPRTWQQVRGKPASAAHHEGIKVRVPPDWSHQDYIPPDWPERDLVSTPGYHSEK